MRFWIFGALLALLPLGCCHPIKALTSNRVGFDSPLQTEIKLVSDAPFATNVNMDYEAPKPTRTDSRVVPMPLDGRGVSRGAAAGPDRRGRSADQPEHGGIEQCR